MEVEMEVKVRRATEADSEAILSMWEEFHNSTLYKNVPFSKLDSGKFLSAMLDGLGIVQVAVAEEEVVGVVAGTLSPYPGNFSKLVAVETTLYVQDKYRKEGACKALAAPFEKVAKQKGASFVFLSALGTNIEVPKKMYESNGYSLAETHFVKELG